MERTAVTAQHPQAIPTKSMKIQIHPHHRHRIQLLQQEEEEGRVEVRAPEHLIGIHRSLQVTTDLKRAAPLGGEGEEEVVGEEDSEVGRGGRRK